MSTDNTRSTISARVEELQKQIDEVGNEIENERQENDADSSVLLELLDKKNFLEQSINELKSSLKNNKLPDTLGIQFKVNMNGSTRAFKIVHPTEANSVKGHISSDSPLAQALEGNRAGDKVKFETPAGPQNIQIIEVN